MDRILTKICLDVLIPLETHTGLKVVDAVQLVGDKLGVDILGIHFEYVPPLTSVIDTVPVGKQ